VFPLPRWARCPLDQHVHLLSPVVVAVAGGEGHGHAGCGRGIPVLGSKAGICLGCIAAGSVTTW
jgi:hypothetical protein